jgi:hypothetical protein
VLLVLNAIPMLVFLNGLVITVDSGVGYLKVAQLLIDILKDFMLLNTIFKINNTHKFHYIIHFK